MLTDPIPRRSRKLKRIGQTLCSVWVRTCEKAGKKTSALDYYSRIMKEFSSTPPAKTAAERIKALGGKVPTPDPSPFQAAPYVSAEKPLGTPVFTPPKRRRYASQEANRQALNQMINQMGQAAMEDAAQSQAATQRRMLPQPVGPRSHYCGAPTLDGTPCMRLVIGFGYCSQHR